MRISSSGGISNNNLSYKQLIELFNGLFLRSLNTSLVGGHDEPLYRPATKLAPASVCFRSDYLSSALHEVAHWCIAGEQRRQQVDYGYWYEPDGRSPEQQVEFERVEVKPQALEWIFSIAAGIGFRLSADNLDGELGLSADFKDSVVEQAQGYLRNGLPERAAIFYQGLIGLNTGRPADISDFSLSSLMM